MLLVASQGRKSWTFTGQLFDTALDSQQLGQILRGTKVLCAIISVQYQRVHAVKTQDWVDPNCGPFAAMGLEVSKRGLGFVEWFASAAKSKYGVTDAMALFL